MDENTYGVARVGRKWMLTLALPGTNNAKTVLTSDYEDTIKTVRSLIEAETLDKVVAQYGKLQVGKNYWLTRTAPGGNSITGIALADTEDDLDTILRLVRGEQQSQLAAA